MIEEPEPYAQSIYFFFKYDVSDIQIETNTSSGLQVARTGSGRSLADTRITAHFRNYLYLCDYSNYEKIKVLVINTENFNVELKFIRNHNQICPNGCQFQLLQSSKLLIILAVNGVLTLQDLTGSESWSFGQSIPNLQIDFLAKFHCDSKDTLEYLYLQNNVLCHAKIANKTLTEQKIELNHTKMSSISFLSKRPSIKMTSLFAFELNQAQLIIFSEEYQFQLITKTHTFSTQNLIHQSVKGVQKMHYFQRHPFLPDEPSVLAGYLVLVFFEEIRIIVVTLERPPASLYWTKVTLSELETLKDIPYSLIKFIYMVEGDLIVKQDLQILIYNLELKRGNEISKMICLQNQPRELIGMSNFGGNILLCYQDFCDIIVKEYDFQRCQQHKLNMMFQDFILDARKKTGSTDLNMIIQRIKINFKEEVQQLFNTFMQLMYIVFCSGKQDILSSFSAKIGEYGRDYLNQALDELLLENEDKLIFIKSDLRRFGPNSELYQMIVHHIEALPGNFKNHDASNHISRSQVYGFQKNELLVRMLIQRTDDYATQMLLLCLGARFLEDTLNQGQRYQVEISKLEVCLCGWVIANFYFEELLGHVQANSYENTELTKQAKKLFELFLSNRNGVISCAIQNQKKLELFQLNVIQEVLMRSCEPATQMKLFAQKGDTQKLLKITAMYEYNKELKIDHQKCKLLYYLTQYSLENKEEKLNIFDSLFSESIINLEFKLISYLVRKFSEDLRDNFHKVFENYFCTREHIHNLGSFHVGTRFLLSIGEMMINRLRSIYRKQEQSPDENFVDLALDQAFFLYKWGNSNNAVVLVLELVGYIEFKLSKSNLGHLLKKQISCLEVIFEFLSKFKQDSNSNYSNQFVCYIYKHLFENYDLFRDRDAYNDCRMIVSAQMIHELSKQKELISSKLRYFKIENCMDIMRLLIENEEIGQLVRFWESQAILKQDIDNELAYMVDSRKQRELYALLNESKVLDFNLFLQPMMLYLISLPQEELKHFFAQCRVKEQVIGEMLHLNPEWAQLLTFEYLIQVKKCKGENLKQYINPYLIEKVLRFGGQTKEQIVNFIQSREFYHEGI